MKASRPTIGEATATVTRLQAAGFTAYWAGGCVRDMLLGTDPKDYDIATDATPEAVLELFPGSVAVGKAFGVVRARMGDSEFEVATFRRDHAYHDGRRPEAVTFSDAQTDARRRDFTINALFYDPTTRQVHDYIDGRHDIQERVLRCVGDPRSRFQEDALRLLRAVRFASVLEFEIDAATAEAVRDCAGLAARVSGERIREELTRILLESRRAGAALRMLRDLGLLAVLLPEVLAMQGVEQPPEFHPEGDVFEHTVAMLDLMETLDPLVAFSVLLHDVGKPAKARRDAQRIRFDGHASYGADVAQEVLHRLRFPTSDIKAIAHCVAGHMRFMDVQRMRESKVRRLVGGPTFAVELELHRLDCLASHGKLENYDFLIGFRDRMAAEPVLPEPWVSGHDILQMGVAQGPPVGTWRDKAYDAQLERRFESRQELIDWLHDQIKTSAGHSQNGAD